MSAAKVRLAVVWLVALASPLWAGSPGEDLVKAGKKGALPKPRQLLDRGASVNAKDGDGHTALLRAAQEGHAEMARLLLDAGADPNLTDKDHKTALWEAARHDEVDIVALLIQ